MLSRTMKQASFVSSIVQGGGLKFLIVQRKITIIGVCFTGRQSLRVAQIRACGSGLMDANVSFVIEVLSAIALKSVSSKAKEPP